MKELTLYYRLVFLTLNVLYFWPGFSAIDFSGSCIYLPIQSSERMHTYATVLQEEIEKRSGLQWTITNKFECKKIIALDHSPLPDLNKEGFSIRISNNQDSVIIHGFDERGVLYGIGYFLRKITAINGTIEVPEDLKIITNPAYEIRGHQLGYRPKTNAYDAWDRQQFDQYIRELAFFGANSIEIMPPRTDDDFTSVHMRKPAAEMIVDQSKICDAYDLDVWMWYPNMGSDFSHPDSLKKELDERHRVFSSLPRLDHLFVPGGDPGELDPSLLFGWLDKVSVVLHQYHPNAKIWISPQVFRPTAAWFEVFYREINKKPDWLGGVVFGPWVEVPLEVLRGKINKDIPIRRYPDITHSLSAQYPFSKWDLSFAITLGRECINPRPVDEKQIHNVLARYANGSISYSEGTNDDLNKFVWSAQDWNPSTPVIETLRDYSRLFIDPLHYEAFAQGFLSIEKNTRGPLASNTEIESCLKQWQALEKVTTPEVKEKFRFQMGLIRAYFDAYQYYRYYSEKERENRVKNLLSAASETTVTDDLQRAISELKKPINHPASYLKERCFNLADDLFESIGAQLTVEKHHAMKGRGNFIDQIDLPLTDAPFYLDQLGYIEELTSSNAKINALEKLLNRDNPGAGGFYNNLGDQVSWARVILHDSLVNDPGNLRTPRVSFGVGMIGEEWVHEITPQGFRGQATPLAWMNQITTLYNTPLEIRYDQLNPKQRYKLRVAYTGRFRSKQKLAIDGVLIHDYLQTGLEPIYEFIIPEETYQDGKIELKWTCPEGERGTQVSEIWIIPIP
ncbi:MAG: hypothetical protein KDC53_00050 [Saprospiraceae bacterium]|nr:hypothetical protein [Saprospiraceae bacterium]